METLGGASLISSWLCSVPQHIRGHRNDAKELFLTHISYKSSFQVIITATINCSQVMQKMTQLTAKYCFWEKSNESFTTGQWMNWTLVINTCGPLRQQNKQQQQQNKQKQTNEQTKNYKKDSQKIQQKVMISSWMLNWWPTELRNTDRCLILDTSLCYIIYLYLLRWKQLFIWFCERKLLFGNSKPNKNIWKQPPQNVFSILFLTNIVTWH